MHFSMFPEIIPTFYVSMMAMMISQFGHSAHQIKVSQMVNKILIAKQNTKHIPNNWVRKCEFVLYFENLRYPRPSLNLWHILLLCKIHIEFKIHFVSRKLLFFFCCFQQTVIKVCTICFYWTTPLPSQSYFYKKS